MIANPRLTYTRPPPAWPWRVAVVGAALALTILTALLVPLADRLSTAPAGQIEYRTVELSDWRPPPPPVLAPRPPPPAKPPPPQAARPLPRLAEPVSEPPPRLRLPMKLDFTLSDMHADLALDFTIDPKVQDIPETSSTPGRSTPAVAASPQAPVPPTPERFDRAPTVLSQRRPTYPYAARTRRIEGHVDLQFTVTAQGRVEGATVLAAEPRNVFEQAALAAVRRWVFSPALRAGRAVPALMQIRIHFNLEEP